MIAWKCVSIYIYIQITDRNFNTDLEGDRLEPPPRLARFENILYFLQTKDNICNQGIFQLQIEDNICNYGIFLVEDNANICFLGIMYAL